MELRSEVSAGAVASNPAPSLPQSLFEFSVAGAPAGGQTAFIELFQQIADGLPEQTALLDQDWNILVVNQAWTRSANLYGYFELLPGANYLSFCQAKSAEGHSPATVVVAGIQEIQSGVRDSLRFIYRGRDRWEGHAFQFSLNKIHILGSTFTVASRHEVTELLQLRKLREEFSQSVIEGQAAERRRIGRELHDSTLQLLAALSFSVGQLKRAPRAKPPVGVVVEMEQLLKEAQDELRSITYLAHPPVIDQLGLADALGTLVDGFARRTGLKISLTVDSALKLSWQAANVALYRVVQEALANVHRHAHATEAAIRLTTGRTMTHVVVSDNGVGLKLSGRSGVGLPSMRARLRELGGRLFLRQGSTGAVVIASIPAESHIRVAGDLSVNA